MNIKEIELRKKMEALAAAASAKIDEITEDTPEARAAEIEVEFDKINGEWATMRDRAERAAAAAAMEAAAEESRAKRRPGSTPLEADPAHDPDIPTYSKAFREFLVSKAEGRAIQPAADAVLRAGYKKLTPEQRAQTTTAAAGGYTVPTEIADSISVAMAIYGPMLDPALTFEMKTSTGAGITIPTVNDTANETAAAAGEGVTLTDDGTADVVFGSVDLSAFMFDTEWLRVSVELATDSAFDIGPFIGALLGERLGRIGNRQATTGTGAGQPHGAATASAVGHVAAATNAITWDEIIDLVGSVDAAYRPTGTFMLHDSTLTAIKKLKDGNGNYLWNRGNAAQGVPETIDGRPYRINNAMATLASGVNSRVMLFGDFKKFVVRKVGDPVVGAIQDKDFYPGFGMAGYMRADSALTDTTALKHLALAAV